MINTETKMLLFRYSNYQKYRFIDEHTKIIHEINDLKGMCSHEKKTDFDNGFIGSTITNLTHKIEDTQEMYDEITEKLYSVLNTYVKRMK